MARQEQSRRTERGAAACEPAAGAGLSGSEAESLRRRLLEAEETLAAIRSGGVDALVVAGDEGERVFTLQGTETPYRRVFEEMREGAATVGAHGHVLFSNRCFAEMVGRDSDEVRGLPLAELVEPDDRDLLASLLRTARRVGACKGEVRLRNEGGHGLPAQLSVSHIDGESDLICLVATDLTLQKHNEQIVAAERLARSILDNAVEAILVCDGAGRVQRANKAAREMCGDVLLGRFPEVVSLETRDGGDPVAAALLGEVVRGVEARLSATGCGPRDVLVSAGPLFGSERAGGGCVVTLVDITERKRVLEALRESEERFQVTLKSSPVIVLNQDRELRYTWAHNTPPEFPAEALLGRTDLEALPAPAAQTLTEAKRAVLETGKGARVEVALPVDGGPRTYDVTIEPAYDRERRIDGVTVAAVDVSERKRAEEALRESERRHRELARELAAHRDRLEELVAERTRALRQSLLQLRRSERLASIGTLAAGVAHEINNPLNSILMTARHARRLPGKLPLEEVLDTIEQEARRGARVVKGILKFARAEKTELRRGDLDEAVRAGADLARKYAGQTRLKLELELAGDLPPVLLDPTEIEQVAVNLITNAVQVADGPAHVHVRTAARDSGVELCVRDQGPGMTPEVLSHVFDPFFSTRRSQGGTGLGLSICHGIAVDHGGTISAESEPGRGATFRLWLPAAPPASS